MNCSCRREAPLVSGVRLANPVESLGEAHDNFWAKPIDLADVAKLVDALV
jgi:hypothetical protein